ncbi:T-cell activation Rho GTPase-activating protein-like [Zonotrichia albicollis]|uniref:T-cell activation Rho GTPase-activating protein-like n=1 Tax=Zonotrichia albicollis TaxID=44394 RepID=UPI003D80E2CA
MISSRVADKLPRPNLVLLKLLLSLLHHISQNAETNRMDSCNLAICIGPNLLSPGTASALPLEVQKEMNNKVTVLVEFLINNCMEIFEGDTAFPACALAEESPEHTDSFTELNSEEQQVRCTQGVRRCFSEEITLSIFHPRRKKSTCGHANRKRRGANSPATVKTSLLYEQSF